jgi:outer membrane receptor protein involved in Fe transport
MLVCLAQLAFGGTSGKIAGRVVDGSTGERLPGVNVTIDDTQLGATTDVNGNYFIINVPVGTYTVRASAVGYTPKGVSAVRVIVDMTTTVDFSLSSREIQTDEIVVSASRPAIQQDKTSTKYTIDRDVINALPVDDFRQVVQVQAGVSGSHFRGGRFNESLFMVDGVQLRSPVNGYTGYTGGFAANIPQINVDEVQVSTGGFEAEYGNAQSGVVNTLTRDASGRFSAKLRVRTSDFPWAKMELKPNQYGSGLPDWKDYEGFFASPYVAFGDMKLAVTGSADIARQNRGFLTHQNFHQESYQGKILGSSGGSRFSVSGLLSTSEVNDYYHRYSAFGPLSDGYQWDLYERVAGTTADPILERYIFVSDPRGTPAPVVRTVADSVLFNGVKYGKVRDIYQTGMQEHISIPQTTTWNVGVSWNQTLSKNSFLDLKLSQFYTRFHEVVHNVDDRAKNGDVNAELNWQDNVTDPFTPYGYKDRQFIESYWYYTGDEGWWFDQVARTYSLRADYSNQFNQTNLLKAGAEVNYSKGDVQKVSFESVTSPRFDIWNEDLVEFAVYAQDKIEVRDGFILNAGLRLDYFNPNGLGSPVLFPANPTDLSNPIRRSTLTTSDKVPSRWQLSPRIGIAHPITERDNLHFYYGHFFQRPDLRYLYENVNLDFRYSTNVDIGNPRLAPEKTVSYEVGWEHLFSDFLRAGITGYYKDITNLVTATTFSVTGASESYQVYVNQDYANVRGLEFTLETLGQVPIGGMINYSYAFASGRSSSVFKGNTEIVPRRLDPLDWDIRHRINANLILRSFGAVHDVIGDAELTFLVLIRSGYPYTTNTRDAFPLFVARNDGRLPWTKNVDMRFRKTWTIGGNALSLLAEVLNLFDWRNISYIAGDRDGLTIYNATGDPSGPYHDPQTYTPPRVYRLGVEIQL